ncbi:MAG: citrate lyase holo-[acyl-carrier protein] synthase [Anaerococcus sp.]|nr:citrate lyase holo-[acyl-carrier protein] synthase [Anaerococcus sp.]
MELFIKGDRPSLIEVLDRREARDRLIRSLDKQYKDLPVLSFFLNIPGPVKNNEPIRRIFSYGLVKIRESLEGKISYEQTYQAKSGPEAYIIVECDPYELKKLMVGLEDSEIGRLFDIDIFYKGSFISREEVGEAKRKCFLCEKDAKLCARSRAHSLEDMLTYIGNIMKKYL